MNFYFSWTKKKIDICLLSETWLLPTNLVSIRNYNIIRTDRSDGYAGSAILIHKKLFFISLSLTGFDSNQFQISAAKCNDITFVSVYSPPNKQMSFSDWTRLSSQISSPFLIGGDFNAHHLTWGSYTNNTAGDIIYNFLEANNVCLLNDGSCTKIPPPENSAVDLTITSANLSLICSWKTLFDSHGSNHLPIVVDILRSGTTLNRVERKVY